MFGHLAVKISYCKFLLQRKELRKRAKKVKKTESIYLIIVEKSLKTQKYSIPCCSFKTNVDNIKTL